MKTILYMATSLTGKTTSGEDDTSWVESADVERMDAVKPIVTWQGKSLFNSADITKQAKLLELTKLDNGSIELVYELTT